MSRFRICLISPPGYAHSACFSEIIRLLWLSIRENGCEVDFSLNSPARDRVNILIGYHLVPFQPPWSQVDTVIWQLEQLDDSPNQWNSQREAHLRHARKVWDFSPVNAAFLLNKGINAQPLVPGHHPAMKTIRPAPLRDIDILFYGSVGDRRRILLGRLSESFRLQALFGVYGAERDSWIARSRLVINIHHYSAQLFESVRVSHLLNNQTPILSENSPDLPWPDIGLKTADYDEIPALCSELLGLGRGLEDLARLNHDRFARHYPMPLLLHPLLKELE